MINSQCYILAKESILIKSLLKLNISVDALIWRFNKNIYEPAKIMLIDSTNKIPNIEKIPPGKHQIYVLQNDNSIKIVNLENICFIDDTKYHNYLNQKPEVALNKTEYQKINLKKVNENDILIPPPKRRMSDETLILPPTKLNEEDAYGNFLLRSSDDDRIHKNKHATQIIDETPSTEHTYDNIPIIPKINQYENVSLTTKVNQYENVPPITKVNQYENVPPTTKVNQYENVPMTKKVNQYDNIINNQILTKTINTRKFFRELF